MQVGPYALPYLGEERLEGLPMAYSWKNKRLQDWIALGCYTWAKWSKVKQSSPACLAAFASRPVVFSFMSLSLSTFSIWSLDNFSACHTRLCSWACLATQTLPFFEHFACCWNPFTRLKVKKDVCLLFPQVYQTISNIPSTVGCAMQDANGVPSAGLSICFPGRHHIWPFIKQSWLSREFLF